MSDVSISLPPTSPPSLPDDPFSPHVPTGSGVSSSMLDELAAELAAPAERAPVEIPVPARPGWSIRARSNISLPELEGWRDRAKVPGPRGPTLDQVQWAEMVVGGSTLAILKDGQEVLDSGETVTFRSAWLQRTLGAASAAASVRKFFLVDPHMTGAAFAILRASGFDDELAPLDPTTAS